MTGELGTQRSGLVASLACTFLTGPFQLGANWLRAMLQILKL